MRDAFGVEKAFSLNIPGPNKFKPITHMTGHELEGIKGYHKAAHGMTEESKAVKESVQRQMDIFGRSPNLNAKKARNRKGKPVAVVEVPKKGGDKSSFWLPSFPRPGQSQRTMTQRITAPSKGSIRRHEMEHTTRRKPASASIRFMRHPEKLWADEARADSVMSAKFKAKRETDPEAYPSAARAFLAGDRPKVGLLYQRGLDSGGANRYLDVQRRLKEVRGD